MTLKISNNYGLWTVISLESSRKNYILCKCICGLVREIKKYDLFDKSSTSCGSKGCKGFLQKQGFDSTSRIYNIWKALKNRCNNPKSSKYINYGGRGIKYDSKWETLSGFWEDMKEGYEDHLTIDRIDVNGDYCKENCKWSTIKEQSDNKVKTKYLTYKNRTQTITKWAEELEIKRSVLYNRLKLGWPTDKIIEVKVKHYKCK